MEQDTDDKNIISKLFVSKERIVERLNSLVNLSSGLITIVEETGEVFFDDESENINNTDRIFLFTLGNYFSFKSGLRDEPQVTISEIANKLNVPNTTIPAPMKNLLDQKVILKSEKGYYKINFDNYKRIKQILLKIRHKFGKNEVEENESWRHKGIFN